MQRIYQINEERDLEVSLTDITPNDQQDFNRLINGFNQSHNDAATMVQEIRGCFSQGQISSKVIERFSKWCNTGGTYQNAQGPARNLSDFLFGSVLPRLVDKQNNRVQNYRQQLITILQQFIL